MSNDGSLFVTGLEAGTFAVITVYRTPDGAPTASYREVMSDGAMPVLKGETAGLLREMADQLDEIAQRG